HGRAAEPANAGLKATHPDSVANLECHQVLANFERPRIGLARLRDEIVDSQRRNLVAGQKDEMCVGGKLRFARAKTRPASRGVVWCATTRCMWASCINSGLAH